MSMSALRFPVSAMKTPIAQILTAPIPVLVDKGILVMDELAKVSNLAAKENPDTICPCPCPCTTMKYSQTPVNTDTFHSPPPPPPPSVRIIKQGVTVILIV